MFMMDAKQAAFYKKVVNFLEVKMGFDCTKKVFRLHSGDNSVLMKGELAGHSLAELKEWVAKVQGKKVEYED